MKVFISWSGERSQALATALHEWLPLVLHYVEPWLSEADVEAGDRWAQEVSKELEVSNFGIICVTPENVGAPWVLFEAGALAKSMQGAKVVPLLFNLEFSDITGPLAQFQAKKVERNGLSEIIQSINHGEEEAIPEQRAKQLFEALWPEFEKRLESIPAEAPTARHTRPQHEILEELVASVRGLDSRFREIDSALSSPRSRNRLRRGFHPMMIDKFGHLISEDGGGPVQLLMIAGVLRDDAPWLSEIIIESYRELKNAGPKDRHRVMTRLRRVSEFVREAPIMEEFMQSSSRETLMIMRELPMFFDSVFHQFDRRLNRSPSNECEPDDENTSND